MSLFSEFNLFKNSPNLLRGLVTGTQNFLGYLFTKKRSKGPMYLSWNITYDCNCFCSCCSVKEKNSTSQSELTTDQALGIIRQAGAAKVFSLGFTGGEPLMRKDIFLLIKEAKKNQLNVKLNTNGVLLEKFAKDIVASNVDSVTVSLDSFIPEVHDQIRNFPGAYKQIERGIENLKKLRKNKKPEIVIRCVISKSNYQNLDKIIDQWQKKVDKIWLQPIHHGIETSLHNIRDNKYLEMLTVDPKLFTENFKKLQKKYKFLRNDYYNQFPDYFKNKNALKKYQCFSGTFNLKLDPFGNVYTCAQMIYPVGNLKKNSLMEIFNSEKLNQIRKILKDKKNDCICWTNDSVANVYMNKLLKKL